jgi:UDP-2,3-diacylglucosamine pyrophosphatase LpxH
MSKYLLIGDLHLGSDEHTDNFGNEAIEDLKDFIRWKNKQGIKRTILMGDIYELWQGMGFTKSSRIKRIRKRYAEILNDIKHWFCLAGNHDWYLHDTENMPEEYIIKEDGMHINCLHGHQFDAFFGNKAKTAFSKLATEVWGVVESIFGIEKTSKVLVKLEAWYNRGQMEKEGNGRDKDAATYTDLAVKYAKESKSKYIFLGHTHLPELKKIKGITYGNTGTWIDGRRDFILIDTKKKQISLYTWTSGRAKLVKRLT